jgi:hypothetical protein
VPSVKATSIEPSILSLTESANQIIRKIENDELRPTVRIMPSHLRRAAIITAVICCLL